jgi:ubiquinone/menaquinone biosynthesis C-methylase UbiE
MSITGQFMRAALPSGSQRRRLTRNAVRLVSPTLAGKLWYSQLDATQREEHKLKRIWQRQSPDLLDVYLVSGFQDPRINPQSIVLRHTLIRALFGSEFDALMHEELAHAASLNRTLHRRQVESGTRLAATMDEEQLARVQEIMHSVADDLAVFAERWRAALEGREVTPLRVLEFACGSANDYRAFVDYGLAQYLDYTGRDLNDANVANAKRRFPDVDFRVGSVLSLPDPDQSVDYVIGCDILEHLSLRAMYTALEQAERLARRGVHFVLFWMDEVPEHEEIPLAAYYRNLLSAPRMREYMNERYESVELVNIPKLLKDEYGFAHYYAGRTYSLTAESPRQRSDG